jgi:hypothetical protein
VQIIDFQHVAGHVGEFANVFRQGEKAKRRATTWCPILKHAGGRQLMRVLERLDRKQMPSEVQAAQERLLTYLGNHGERRDYPRYSKQGWQVASGAVESGCKTVVNHRLCLGGRRWGEPGSDAVAHLRALYRSDADQGEAFGATAA